jgi:pilus assembly protein TadC
MPYDSSLDEKIFADSWESESTRINVSVFSYNKGPKKVQVTRENKDATGNFRFTKLGRMSKEELEAILPLLQQALAAM